VHAIVRAFAEDPVVRWSCPTTVRTSGRERVFTYLFDIPVRHCEARAEQPGVRAAFLNAIQAVLERSLELAKAIRMPKLGPTNGGRGLR
jgi:hypothetical protein